MFGFLCLGPLFDGTAVEDDWIKGGIGIYVRIGRIDAWLIVWIGASVGLTRYFKYVRVSCVGTPVTFVGWNESSGVANGDLLVHVGGETIGDVEGETSGLEILGDAVVGGWRRGGTLGRGAYDGVGRLCEDQCLALWMGHR